MREKCPVMQSEAEEKRKTNIQKESVYLKLCERDKSKRVLKYNH